jgi:ornithine cyclodeaminase/alanine dehydrogenase-like protein (mu-crystallin family)
MRYLSPVDVLQALPMQAAIAAMETAFSDDREMPVRALLGSSLFMPGRVGPVTGVKVVSVVPGRPFGIVAVFGVDGNCRGMVDGPSLTALRTGAAAGLATRLLARPESTVMAMLGAGRMASDQVRAVREVRPISRLLVWSRDLSRARRLAADLEGTAVADASEAVAAADVITCATPATEPLFAPEAIKPGAHLNAIGAFTPDMVEVPPEVVRGSRVFVDDLSAAAAEAGDLLRAGVLPLGTIGDLLAGRLPGRESREQLTLFKSVGIASQDVAAAAAALERAARLGIGTEIDSA